MSATFDARNFASAFAESMNSRNADKMLPYYAPNVELRDPSTIEPLRGHEGVRKNLALWSRAFSDVKIDVKEVVQSSDRVAYLFDISARHTGELEIGPGETVPATNKTTRTEAANFLSLENGKIVKDLTIFDMAMMMQQLGLMPSSTPVGKGERAVGARR